MKKIKIFIMIIAILLMTGCTKNMNNTDEYKADRNIYLYSLNTDSYLSAIEDLIYYSGWDLEDVDIVLNNHSTILTDSFIAEYRSQASTNSISDNNNEDTQAPEIEDLDDTNYDYGENTLPEIIDTPDIENGQEQDEGGLPYGDTPEDEDTELNLNKIYNSLIAYGLEETENEGQDGYWDKQHERTKVYEVLVADAYKDRLVCSVIYKYGSPMKVVVDLVDGKIDGYTIYR